MGAKITTLLNSGDRLELSQKSENKAMLCWNKVFVLSQVSTCPEKQSNCLCPESKSFAFLGDDSRLDLFLKAETQEKFSKAVKEFHVLAWMLSDDSCLLLTFDDEGVTQNDFSAFLGNLNINIPKGCIVDTRDPGCFVMRAADGCKDITFGSQKKSTVSQVQVSVDEKNTKTPGTLQFSARIPSSFLEASIRYFYNDPEEDSSLGGFDYPVFVKQNGPPMDAKISLDVARPYGAYNSLTILDEEKISTNFRTVLGHVINLTSIPEKSGVAWQWDPIQKAAYSVLYGSWKISVDDSGSDTELDMMLGLSGTEFAKVANETIMEFVPDAPAYSHGFLKSDQTAEPALQLDCPDSDYPVTTSWIYFKKVSTSPINVGASSQLRGYYSQPESAGLYTLPAPDDSLSGTVFSFLQVFDLRSAIFPQDAKGVETPAASFPAVPYGGVVSISNRDLYNDFEVKILTPFRSKVIYEIDANVEEGPSGLAASFPMPTSGEFLVGLSAPTGPTGPDVPTLTTVTPQGLLSHFTSDPVKWQSLLLAKTDFGYQSLMYTDVEGQLQQALLNNQLFLVVSDKEKLQKYCSVLYRVTQDALNKFQNVSPAPPPLVVELANKFTGNYSNYFSRTYFYNEVKRVFGEDNEKWVEPFVKLCEFSQLTISGWVFQLAPNEWDEKTILIIKFAEQGVGNLINDQSLWTLADKFNENTDTTQKRLKGIVKDSIKSQKTESEFDYFVNTVLANGNKDDGIETWNGVLYLDCAVPPNTFPPQLRGLAAGIDETKFRAHHLGVNISSIKSDEYSLNIDDSSLFGLIYYQDQGDLMYQSKPYDFKVLHLRVLFANSEITSFASQIELLVASLFSELSTLQDSNHGNNIILNGIWQKHGDEDSYAFLSTDRDEFAIESHVLDYVLITKAQFVTLIPEGGFKDGQTDVASRFIFTGQLQYKKLDGFDLFSFGDRDAQSGLNYTNMMISMKHDSGNDENAQFDFVAGQMVFDNSASLARPSSLYKKFPLSVSAMLQSDLKSTPPDQGFLVVSSPVPTGSLGNPWFGINMELSFGSPGGLAEKVGFSGSLLAAWSPDKGAPNVAIGIQLPGSEGKSITIEGPLKLNIGDIKFIYHEADDAYLMKFQNIALSFLALSFPPGGKTNMLLFGDPDPDSDNSKLGWYAAYKKDSDTSAKRKNI